MKEIFGIMYIGYYVHWVLRPLGILALGIMGLGFLSLGIVTEPSKTSNTKNKPQGLRIGLEAFGLEQIGANFRNRE